MFFRDKTQIKYFVFYINKYFAEDIVSHWTLYGILPLYCQYKKHNVSFLYGQSLK